MMSKMVVTYMLHISALTILMMLQCCHGDAIIDSGSSPDLETRVLRLGKETVVLDCGAEDATFKHWVTPYNMILDENFSGNNRLQLLPGNYSLQIKAVDGMDLGDYLCLTEDDEGRLAYYRHNLYLYVQPTWEVYRHNFIVAICCAGAFLVIVGTILVVYTCRWQNKDDGSECNEDSYSLEDVHNGYISPVVIDDDTPQEVHPIKPSADTKM